MDRHAEARDLGDLRRVEVGGVVRAVRYEHDGGDGPRLRAAQHVQQRFADVRDRARRRHLLERRQLDELAGEREQVDGELALERRQRAVRQAVDGLLEPRRRPRRRTACCPTCRAARRPSSPAAAASASRAPAATASTSTRGDERRLQRAEHRRAHDTEARAAAPDRDADDDGRRGASANKQPTGQPLANTSSARS